MEAQFGLQDSTGRTDGMGDAIKGFGSRHSVPVVDRIEKCLLTLNDERTKYHRMRERRNLEKSHLPESVYETWLQSQAAGKEGKRHRAPAEDLYEAWIKRRVSQTLERPQQVQVRERRKKGARTRTPRIAWVQWN